MCNTQALQRKLPIWLGVGGTPASFVRAGSLGLPLMVAIIGGDTARFRPLVDLYREAGRRAGFSRDQLKVGLHSPGYVAQTYEQAIADYYPGYAELWTKLGKERGWPPVTRSQFNALIAPEGVLVVGGPEQVAEKLVRHSEALGGVDRFTFQMDNAGLSHQQLLQSIELIGTKVIPHIKHLV
ncbi:LLM class flavin-dependent oxidoreductase [Rhodocytophaga aerolata]|uniref:LLM class flavin-dependent oxidoreductase n=1 Tax=Rhodocytophaga aerolata TaxID=455078 RepID=UPI00360FCCCE